MVNPDLLQDAVVQALRSAPEIIAVHNNDPARIISYDEQFASSQEAFAALQKPGTLVLVEGNEPGSDSANFWTWVVLIISKLERNKPYSRFGAWAALILNSHPQNGELDFTQFPIHPDFEMVESPILSRLDDANGIEYPQIKIKFRQTTLG